MPDRELNRPEQQTAPPDAGAAPPADSPPTPSDAGPERLAEASDADLVEEVARRRADRARQALVSPWSPRRARRVRIIALLLVFLGPVLGTAVALLLVPAQEQDVVAFDDDDRSVIDVRGVIRGVDPTTGEMAVRLVISRGPGADELDGADGDPIFDGAVLAQDLTLLVNDANGRNSHTLPAGQPPGTITTSLALTDSRPLRYPFDRYRATLLVVATPAGAPEPAVSFETSDAGGDGGTDVDSTAEGGELDDASEEEPPQPVAVRLSLRASDNIFGVEVIEDHSADDVVAYELRVVRKATVVGWAGFFVLVCWLLALAAASLGWTTVVHGITSPGWAWGFLIGVLFALPPLRNALPGTPPLGSLVDLAAFYWAVGIVTLTLVAMVGSWNVRVRQDPNEPDSPNPGAARN